MIEMFTGLQLGDILKDKIMHPSNAIALQGDVHKAFDNLLWSIEAVTQENNNIVLPSLKRFRFLVLNCFGIAIYIPMYTS
jgi:hypothetical protein